ncbi:hypothetical protein ADUPG1_007943 [Aduncisulcus paluster]|uniref:Uncharacterized protein n=1 Tax=Aduncisulcus paluster TaxID=2918883 RepID=A0ABQ5KT99_9EUKA|nr:hypothetical protein ADUPG1_007943 [Aduncisulcus paluster]
MSFSKPTTKPFSKECLEQLRVSIKMTTFELIPLYEKSQSRLQAIFDEYTTPSAITSNRDLFALCFECLSLFVKHKVTKEEDGEEDIVVIPHKSSIKKIIDPFLPQMIKKKKKKGKEGEEEESGTKEAGVNSITMSLFRIICVLTAPEYDSLSLCSTILPQISPFLSNLLTLGISQKLENSFIEDILEICRYIAFAKDNSTRDSLLSILRPHILPWMRRYPDKKFFLQWIIIFQRIICDEDNEHPHEDRSLKLWFVFHPVLDVIKDTDSKGITFDNSTLIACFELFISLSYIHSQAIEVYDSIKDGLLDSWFIVVKKESEKGNDWGIKNWVKLVSLFSTIPSIAPQLSPKYDDQMEWGMNNNCWIEEYTQYIRNLYPSLKKWVNLFESIIKADSESTSKLYHKHREEILSVFLAYQSKSEIEEHKREIILCVHCLNAFVGHRLLSGDMVSLPFTELNDPIDTFIGHISRVEEVLKEYIDGDFLKICENFCYFNFFEYENEEEQVFCKLSLILQHILERGSKEKLDRYIIIRLLDTLFRISDYPSTRSYILTLIKPFLIDWLRIYKYIDGEYCAFYGQWAYILSQITLSSDNETSNISVCAEAWPLFHPILEVIRREFAGNMLAKYYRDYILDFLANLCYDQSHAAEVYDNLKHFLGEWYELLSMISSVSHLIPELSPQYDEEMKMCLTLQPCHSQYELFTSNVSSFLSCSYLSNNLLHSIPPVSLIPSIETSLCPEKDGYSYASHVCSVMEFIITIVYSKQSKISYFNIVEGGKEMKIHLIRRGKLCCSHADRSYGNNDHEEYEEDKFHSIPSHKILDEPSSQKKQSTLMGEKQEAEEEKNSIISFEHNYRIKHSSIIQYTPPQHLLVKMPFDEERSLRQSVYDFVEHTGGGVESLFDHEMCNVSFEGYDQESWREEMEILEEEEEEEEEEEFLWPGYF